MKRGRRRRGEGFVGSSSGSKPTRVSGRERQVGHSVFVGASIRIHVFKCYGISLKNVA
jgi:hypothetical protein